MCCSGYGPSITAALQLKAAALPAQPAQSARLRYLGPAALSLRGPFSGAVYNPAPRSELQVDPSDLQALLRTGLFEPA